MGRRKTSYCWPPACCRPFLRPKQVPSGPEPLVCSRDGYSFGQAMARWFQQRPRSPTWPSAPAQHKGGSTLTYGVQKRGLGRRKLSYKGPPASCRPFLRPTCATGPRSDPNRRPALATVTVWAGLLCVCFRGVLGVRFGRRCPLNRKQAQRCHTGCRMCSNRTVRGKPIAIRRARADDIGNRAVL